MSDEIEEMIELMDGPIKPWTPGAECLLDGCAEICTICHLAHEDALRDGHNGSKEEHRMLLNQIYRGADT